MSARLLLGATALILLLPAPVEAAGATMRLDAAYHITATLDVGTGRLDAVEVATLTNRSGRDVEWLNLAVLPRAFDYVALDDPVTVDGAPVSVEWTTETNLRVPLPGGMEPDATIEVRVPFTLTVGNSGGAFTARTSRENGVISFGQWFPIVSREHGSHGVGDPQVTATAERVTLDLTTTVAQPRDAVACPGLVEAPATIGTHWRCEVEQVRDFSFVVNPRFRLVGRDVAGVAMRVYTETVDGRVVADLAAEALVAFGEAYGPYPWDDLVLAEVGSGGGFSMEYPRAIHLTRGKVTDTYVVYHEVAHQWFYAQVGNDQMREPFLDEGFADFSARWLMGIGEDQCSSRPVDSPVFAWQAGPTSGGDWLSCDGYFHTVFYRGTEFLNALRAAMGDEAFFTGVRSFVDQHRHGITSIRTLMEHLQAGTDADLEPIRRAYLAAETRPARVIGRT
ncbi:MAG TPA: hypothetical protein VFM19_02790 [Candidatus Limnocylindria bacterium]|nr:hypothetical protein [Candidatus Limnocylindria bacterium]